MGRPGKNDISLYWLDNEEGKSYDVLPDSKRQNDLDHIARFAFLVPEHEQELFWNTYTDTCAIQGEDKHRLSRSLKQHANRYWKKKGIDYSFD